MTRSTGQCGQWVRWSSASDTTSVDLQPCLGGKRAEVVEAKAPRCAHGGEAPDELGGGLIAGGAGDDLLAHIVEGDGEAVDAADVLQDGHHRSSRQVHAVALPEEEGRLIAPETVPLQERQHALGHIVAGDENRGVDDAARGEPLALEAQGARVVDLEEDYARRVLAHGPGVETGAEDDHLAAALGDRFIEAVVEIAGSQSEILPRRREPGRDGRGRGARRLVEKQADDRIGVERIGFGVLGGAKLGNDERCPRHIPDRRHRVTPQPSAHA